jgi:hypothetical protein
VYYTFEQNKTREKREGRAEARDVIDAAEFARKRLRFEPDERQIEAL